MVKFVSLSTDDRRALERFVHTTKDKVEYVRGTALLMRSRGKKAKDVAKDLGISMGAVFKWESIYRKLGIDGLRRKIPPGRPSRKIKHARKVVIPDLLKEDPKAFGFLKGRWVVRDISKALKGEGVEISPTQVHGILKDLGLTYKRPKLTVESTDPQSIQKEGKGG